VQSGAIEQGSGGGFRIRVGKNVEVLLRAVVFSGEAEELEQKSAALGAARRLIALHPTRFDGRMQLPGPVQ